MDELLKRLLLKVNHDSYNDLYLDNYILSQYKYLINDKSITKVYKLISKDKIRGINAEDLILLIVRNYIEYYYNPEDTFSKFLESYNMDDVIYLFNTNANMGKELLKSYYASLLKRPKLKNTQMQKLIMKYDNTIEAMALADILRANYEYLYNTLLINGGNDISLGQSMALIINRQMYIGGHPQIESAIQFVQTYPEYLCRIMYADIYEDMANDGVLEQYDKPAVRIVAKAIREKDYYLPKDMDDTQVLLNYFGYLCTVNKNRSISRKNMSAEEKEKLSEINPLWPLDKSGIIK